MADQITDEILDILGIKGERRKYAKKHGVNALIGMFHGLHWNDEESERVYKICNTKGITWEEYYKIDKSKKVIY